MGGGYPYKPASSTADDEGWGLSKLGWFFVCLTFLIIVATLAVSAGVLGIVDKHKNDWKGHHTDVDSVKQKVDSVDDQVIELNEKLNWIKKDLDHLNDGIAWIKEDLHKPPSPPPPHPPSPPTPKQDTREWPYWGKNLENSKIVDNDDVDENFNVQSLLKGETVFEQQWAFNYEGQVGASATVTTSKDIVYSTAFSGQIVAVDRQNGQQLWVRYGNEILGLPPFNASDPCSPQLASRNAPAIFKNKYGREGIIISIPGVREASPCEQGQLPKYKGPTFTVALDRFTGETMWRTEVHPHPWSVGTSSGTVYKNFYFAGVSSLENSFNLLAGYPCCSFRGRMYSIDINTGALVWATFTVPEGYGGAGVTGSSPAVWPEADLVFFGSGNGYSAPPEIEQCRVDNNYPDKASLQCLEDDVYIDATLAVDIYTGKIVWAFRAQGVDLWTVPCTLGPNPFCPNPAGPDYDLLQSPVLIPPKGWKKPREEEKEDWKEDYWWLGRKSRWLDPEWKKALKDWIVVAHYKSGVMWSFRAIDGKLRCSRATGSAGTLGGGQWGSAADAEGTRLYIIQDTGAPAEPGQEAYLLPNGKEACDGSFWAINVDNCDVPWVAQVAYSRPPDQCGPLNPLEPFDMFTYPPTTGLPTNKTVDGRAQKPISETGKTAAPCPPRSGSPTHLENSEFANAHGALAIARGVVYGATMTGNAYGLRLKDGKCVTQFHCPFGGIYGGISISGDQLFINCGYGRLLPQWLPGPNCSFAQPEACGAGCPDGGCSLLAFQPVEQ